MKNPMSFADVLERASLKNGKERYQTYKCTCRLGWRAERAEMFGLPEFDWLIDNKRGARAART